MADVRYSLYLGEIRGGSIPPIAANSIKVRKIFNFIYWKSILYLTLINFRFFYFYKNRKPNQKFKDFKKEWIEKHP